MHNLFKKLLVDLQFFGEGASAGDGAGDGASSPSMDSLESLGVPKDRVERYRARKGAVSQNTATAVQPAAGAVNEESADVSADDAAWEEAKKNPVINKRMRDTVNARLKDFAKKNGDAKAQLDALAPVLEIVGRKAGVDVSDLSKLNVEEFVQKVSADPSYYEDLAAEMGTDIDTAREIDQRERETSRRERAVAQQQQEMQFRQHYDGLLQQAADLKAAGYNINIQAELEDPWFARVTSPSGGLSVKQAYDAKYHDQMVQATKQASAMQARQAISNAVRAGKGMPTENGVVARATVPTQSKPYSQMSADERAAYYKSVTGQTLNRRRH